MSHSRWNLLPQLPNKYLSNTAGLPPLIIQLLFHRGITEPSQIASFLTIDERLSGDPALLPDMYPAVTRIYRALLGGEQIAIYGDFDTDGISATALLVQGLSLLNCHATPYIPHRLTEGYGLKTAALEELKRQGISLVITVDCGITALAEVKRAKRIGLDIIITDHHTPPEVLPPADAIINPKLAGSNYPFPELAGVGVAFKLLQALFRGIGKEPQLDQLTDLVALGTVADVVPLLGENRYLVKQGLKLINTSPRLGLREIANQCGLNLAKLDAEGISWTIAPRLNAAGRLEHAMGSYRLLMSDSPAEADELAKWLEEKNSERQKLTSQALAKAKEQVLARGISPLLMVGDSEFPVGICGLVASRLAEEFYRPAIVIRTGERISTGSCRSIPEFDLMPALNQCRQLFFHFGGHSQAAGFSLATRNLPRLEQALMPFVAARLEGLDLRPRLDIEAQVSLSELGGDTLPIIRRLAPFGRGNPAPAFLSRRVEIIDHSTMGNGSEHLKFKLKQNGVTWDAVGFRLGQYLSELASPLDIVYNLEVDRWNGQERLRLNLLDFQPSN